MARIHTSVPEGLIPLLESHLPNSLVLLRRLQFTRFKDGKRPTARIILASDAPLPSTTSHQDGETSDQLPHNFCAAYLDFGSTKETQLFMYSTLEDTPSKPLTDKDKKTAESQITAILDAVTQVSKEQPDNRTLPGAVLVGTLATATRDAILRAGVRVTPRQDYEYEKWLFRVDEIPDFEDGVTLPEGATWGPATERDCEIVVSKTDIPRQVKTLLSWPSLILRLEDGTPIAWSFLGTDASLSSLHCEPPYRQRGYAKALASKLMKRSSSEYGADGWASADVAPYNTGSKKMCQSLGGRHTWNVSW
ncbi:acetyltransferase [Colletotrichum salicis]|uniref:Acetyltransferase n=1 Tax=Colletotrichum salicis TaxID=1209931 RepID=A0A135V221_9PEZI|nr:acetyltransferase [Colletotrichum salicis]